MIREFDNGEVRLKLTGKWYVKPGIINFKIYVEVEKYFIKQENTYYFWRKASYEDLSQLDLI